MLVERVPRGDMMEKRSFAAAACALVFLAGPALADEPGVIKCTWPGGTEEYYKIAPNSWQMWNPQAFAWSERECYISPALQEGTTCQISISDTRLTWFARGDVKYCREAGCAYIHSGYSQIVIDRMNGQAAFNYKETNFWYGKPPEPEKTKALAGVCAKAADPALGPKPKPVL